MILRRIVASPRSFDFTRDDANIVGISASSELMMVSLKDRKATSVALPQNLEAASAVSAGRDWFAFGGGIQGSLGIFGKDLKFETYKVLAEDIRHTAWSADGSSVFASGWTSICKVRRESGEVLASVTIGKLPIGAEVRSLWVADNNLWIAGGLTTLKSGYGFAICLSQENLKELKRLEFPETVDMIRTKGDLLLLAKSEVEIMRLSDNVTVSKRKFPFSVLRGFTASFVGENVLISTPLGNTALFSSDLKTEVSIVRGEDTNLVFMALSSPRGRIAGHVLKDNDLYLGVTEPTTH